MFGSILRQCDCGIKVGGSRSPTPALSGGAGSSRATRSALSRPHLGAGQGLGSTQVLTARCSCPEMHPLTDLEQKPVASRVLVEMRQQPAPCAFHLPAPWQSGLKKGAQRPRGSLELRCQQGFGDRKGLNGAGTASQIAQVQAEGGLCSGQIRSGLGGAR